MTTSLSRSLKLDVLPRRNFLVATTALAAAYAYGRSPADQLDDSKTAFVLVGDTHYLADKESPGELDPRSASVTWRVIHAINHLAGSPIPEEAGGGRAASLQGVIHAGDLIDSGDKNGRL